MGLSGPTSKVSTSNWRGVAVKGGEGRQNDLYPRGQKPSRRHCAVYCKILTLNNEKATTHRVLLTCYTIRRAWCLEKAAVYTFYAHRI